MARIDYMLILVGLEDEFCRINLKTSQTLLRTCLDAFLAYTLAAMYVRSELDCDRVNLFTQESQSDDTWRYTNILDRSCMARKLSRNSWCHQISEVRRIVVSFMLAGPGFGWRKRYLLTTSFWIRAIGVID